MEDRTDRHNAGGIGTGDIPKYGQGTSSLKEDQVREIRILSSYRYNSHTITSDNGKEFAGHGEITEALGAGFFFATPYHSWEKGLCEHTNGLVRQSTLRRGRISGRFGGMR